MQWHDTILPKIQSYVPTDRIVEIACGYGRWTQFLKDLCTNLTVIDLSEECIRACQQRFAEHNHIEYQVNDGKSLEMIPESSVDFLFTYDSLVHADDSVLEAYLRQLPRILKHDGVAFIHHSNLGEYSCNASVIRNIPMIERAFTMIVNLETNLHGRDSRVSAKSVETLAKENGLQCIRQEILRWGTRRMQIDCISTIVKKTSSLAGENRIYRYE